MPGGYPVASHRAGQGLEAQARFLEEYDRTPLNPPRRGRPEPLPSERRGPLALPGSVPPTEEMILGDDEGTGVLDMEGYDQAQPAEITPQKDPFAFNPARTQRPRY
jgi:hypothetical protein